MTTLASQVLSRIAAERACRCQRARRAPRRPVCQTTCLVPPAGQVAFFRALGNILMDSHELVAVPCPECSCSPVEVLMTMHSGRRFLWCPQCRAIWAVDTWVLNRPASSAEQPPKVIAFGPLSGRRPF